MNLNDLSATPLADEVDFANLPDQGGSFQPPPPVGVYRFALPKLSLANFSEVDTKEHGKRLKVTFDASAPLVIVQSVGGKHDGEPFQTRLTNTPRPRGKEKILASDLDYLFKALGATARMANNRAAAQYLIERTKAGDATVAASVEYSWNCAPDRDAYFDQGDGSFGPTPSPTGDGNAKGCGLKYYAGAKDEPASPGKAGKIGKSGADEGGYPYRIQCACGAQVRAFANLGQFKA